MLRNCVEEIDSILLCGDCYANMGQNGAFKLVCSKPHLVLWVKYSKFPFWPAKLISIKKGPKPIKVHFFQEHTVADVSYNDCLLYSKEDPNEWCTDRNQLVVQEAIDVRSLCFQYNVLPKMYDFH